jgi:nucleoside-diphosphate-sugar epimerase
MNELLDDDRELICRAFASRAQRLRGARILVTGGSGFFGQWLTEALVALDEEYALGLTLSIVGRNGARLAERTKHLQARWARLTLLAEDVRAFRPPEMPTHVIHAATPASAALNEADPTEMISVIIDGTRNLLSATIDAERFLYVSSGAVYGTQQDSHVAEDFQGGPVITSPRSAYGEGKRLAEVLCAIAAERNHRAVTIARPFAFVGPWLPLDAHFAIGNFLRDGLRGGPIVVAGDGTAVRSYLYAADLTVWLLATLVDGHAGRAYNIGSERPISIGQLAATIGALNSSAVEIRGVPVAGHPAHRYVPSVARARNELGLAESLSLEDALLRTLRWHRRSANAG